MSHRFSTPVLLSLLAIGCTGAPDKNTEKASVPAQQTKPVNTAASSADKAATAQASSTGANVSNTGAKASSTADKTVSDSNTAASNTAKAAATTTDKAVTGADKTVGSTDKALSTTEKTVSNTEKTATKAADTSLLALKVTSLDGKPVDLSAYKGKVALVVNVASKCGNTPQYAGLESMYKELESRGFVILGFPSNDFGGQEPGTPAEIQTFCTENYGVTFPLFSKIQTKAGPDQSPVYAYLNSATGKLPTWNFCKYLVGKDGKVIEFFSSKVKPDDPELRKAVDTALAAK